MRAIGGGAILSIAFMALAPTPGFAAEPVAYEIRIDGAPSDAVTSLIEASGLLFQLQDQGAPNRALLRRRAEGDRDTVERILRSKGRYRATVSTRVVDPAEADAPLTAVIDIDAGPAFSLAEHRFQIESVSADPPALDPAAFGSPIGRDAVASEIVAAETAALAELRNTGFPYASRRDRRTVADLDANTLSVETVIDAGPLTRFGALGFEGLETVEQRYLETYLPWREGELYDVRKVRRFQRDMVGTGLFEIVTVKPPETAPETPRSPTPGAAAVDAPVTVGATEAQHRSVRLGLRFSTDAGPSARVGFEHRNLFGANERFEAIGDVGLEDQSLDFSLRKPQFRRSGQEAVGALSLRNETDDAFDAQTVEATLGVQRQISERWRVGVGGLGEISLIEDEGEDDMAILVGAPTFAAFDGSDDRLNPTQGFRVTLRATPFVGAFDEAPTAFGAVDLTGAAYQRLTEDGRYVVAGRARLGAIASGSVDRVPSPRRLYSGGGGSVRGFEEDFVGPLDADGDPIGGRSAAELGAEVRAQPFSGEMLGPLGFVAFVEAGSVSTDLQPSLEEGVQVGAGAGLRYYSPVGPLRFDVAAPIDPRPEDDAFQIYVSIGQAF